MRKSKLDSYNAQERSNRPSIQERDRVIVRNICLALEREGYIPKRVVISSAQSRFVYKIGEIIRW